MNIMLRFSQLNGLIGDLFNGIGNYITNILSLLFGYIMIILYHFIAVPIFILIDAMQLLFRKFAGLDAYKMEGNVQSGDIVLSLINNPTVQNVFWSLVILAVVLLIITTFVALIRAQTKTSDDKDRKTNRQIFVSSLKALLNFFMVPVVAILGIFMGNALLKSLDKATSGEGSTQLSAMVFTTCAYESNRARLSETFAQDLAENHLNDMGVLKGTVDNIADVIDNAFKNRTTFAATSFDFSKNTSNLFSSDVGEYFYLTTFTLWSGGTAYIPRTSFSIYDMWQVFYYYDLVSFNYLFFLIASLFSIWVLLSTSIGLIKRMFKLIVLLVVSPPIAALVPLDNGAALVKWRKEFIGSTLSAYATIVGLNLTLMLLGPISQIDFFYYSESYTGFIPTLFNQVAQLLILCGALFFFKDLTKSLSAIIGAEDAYADGAKATQEIGAKIAKGGLAAVGLASGYKAINKMKEAQRVGDTKSAEKYKNKAKAQLGAAGTRLASLATNGMSDKIAKENADTKKAFGIKEANAGVKELKRNGTERNIKRQYRQQTNPLQKLSDSLGLRYAGGVLKKAKGAAVNVATNVGDAVKYSFVGKQISKAAQQSKNVKQLAKDSNIEKLSSLESDYGKQLENQELSKQERKQIVNDQKLVQKAIKRRKRADKRNKNKKSIN